MNLKANLTIVVHVMCEKLKRGRSPSLHIVKEGDFAKHFRDIYLVKFQQTF